MPDAEIPFVDHQAGFATEWIIHTVIRNAQALLENSQLTVQQVADYLNFPTPSFFGQYFKKHVGMTPKEYRLSKR